MPHKYRPPISERRTNSSSITPEADFLLLNYLLHLKPLGQKFAFYCRGYEAYLGANSRQPLRVQVNHRKDYLVNQGTAELRRLFLLARSQANPSLVELVPSDYSQCFEELELTPPQPFSPSIPPITPIPSTPPTQRSPAFISPMASRGTSTPGTGGAAAAAAATPRADNSTFQLDFDNPENNPYGVMVFRDPNHSHNGSPHVDAVKVRFYFFDPRDAMSEEGRLTATGGALKIVHCAQPMYCKTNIEDLHEPDDEFFIEQQTASMQRLTGSDATKEVTYLFPRGVTCRTTPFSVTSTVHMTFSDNLTMNFGEQDADGNPVLYGAYWVEYWLAVNKSNEKNKQSFHHMEDLRNRFGNLRH